MKKQVLLLIMMLLPMVASADESGSCGESVTWNFEEATGTLTISGTGPMEDYMGCTEGSTWSKEDIHPFREIGPKIKFVTVNEGVSTIGGGIFAFCPNLISISIPNSVTSIGDVAFCGCSKLSGITISNNISYIGARAFSDCSSIESISIPQTLNFIGRNAFQNCSGLTTLIIPKGIELKSYAFSGCSRLSSLTINEGVIIGPAAFQSCNGLVSLKIPSGVIMGESAFWNCTGLISVTFDDNLTSIGNYTFSRCTSLVNVKIPNRLKALEDGVFYECSSLFAVNLPQELTSIGESSFYGCSSLASINIPNGVTSIGRWAFANCYALNSINIPDGVTSFEENMFYECGNLTSIEIPDGVTAIGNNAFYNCRNLTSVNIPSTVKTIGENAFYGCERLKSSISIPEGVTIIENSTFQNCRDLEVVNLPNSIVTIGESAFYNCCNLKSIVLPDELKMIKKRAFGYCLDLKEITIPAKVEYIYPEAFSNLNSLEKIETKPTTPPFLADDSFSNYNVPLKVPRGYKEAYLSAQGWKNFTYISDADKYILKYVVNNEEYKSYEIEEGEATTSEAAPTKKGYTFSGWSEIPSTMPAHNVTVTGSFSINKYKLIYTVSGEEYKSYEVEYGATIMPEASPTKEGYTFSGWSDILATMPAHDVTVAGSFSINKYKLTYIVNGKEYKSSKIEYGTSITPEAEPTKEGYTFSGWSLIPKTMPAKDVTITGSFTINSYKLTYMVDGEQYKSMQLKYGADITPEAEPTKEGYTFSGWSLIPQTMPAKDVTITGSFIVNSYKLTYMVDDKEYKSLQVKYGAAITPEAEPIKEGYTFSGWDKIPTTMPAQDLEVTGLFTINNYKLIYIVDGEEYKTVNVVYGASITAEAVPSKEGYSFSGWGEMPAKMPANNVTVTGSFTINKYTLAYVVDGEQYKSVQVSYGTTITPEAEPTKEGYTFSGWNLIPETMPAKDVTITGVFTKGLYKLTYLVDGQTYKTFSMDFGTPIIAEEYPTKEGYTFSGWGEMPSSMPAKDVTVTGSFTINSYKLTYMVDGKEYKTIDVEYGAGITPEAEPIKEGYTFSGWSLIPETMPAHDVKITGTFTFVDAIEGVTADDDQYQIYTLDGMPIETLQKGVNIIKYKNGKVQKVVVK